MAWHSPQIQSSITGLTHTLYSHACMCVPFILLTHTHVHMHTHSAPLCYCVVWCEKCQVCTRLPIATHCLRMSVVFDGQSIALNSCPGGLCMRRIRMSTYLCLSKKGSSREVWSPGSIKFNTLWLLSYGLN